MIDVTINYAKMIESFDRVLSLATDPESGYGLDELQFKIEQGDEQVLKDIELLQELSRGVRIGSLRIVKLAGWENVEVQV